MKVDLKTAAFTIFALLLAAASASAQKAGAYKSISKTDAGVQAAAEFAVDAQAERKDLTIELASIEKAEKQVVAGTNFRLCLKVTTSGPDDDSEITSTVKVIVYRNLKGEYSLTSWMEEDCAPESDG
jgi:hypothetical protein